MEPITLEELARAIDGICAIPGAGSVSFERIAFAAEDVRPGDLFWNLSDLCGETGERVSAAESRGAAAVVGSLAAIPPGRRRILVADARAALEQFTQGYRRLLDGCLVGIRGRDVAGATFGLLNAALGCAGPDEEAGSGDRRALCQDLLSLDASAAYHVVDFTALAADATVGAVGMARPEVAVIPRFRCHPVDPTIEALGRILPPGGLLVAGGDGPPAIPTPRRASLALVGRDAGNTHRVASEARSPGRLRFCVDHCPFEIAAPGRQFDIPAAMAVVTARWLGRRDRQIAQDLQAFRPGAGRGNVIRERSLTLINETAAPHPDSLEAACVALSAWPSGGRRILVVDGQTVGRRQPVPAGIDGIDFFVRLSHSTRQAALDAPRAGTESPCLVEFTRAAELLGWLRSTTRVGDVLWIHASEPGPLADVVARFCTRRDPAESAPMAA